MNLLTRQEFRENPEKRTQFGRTLYEIFFIFTLPYSAENKIVYLIEINSQNLHDQTEEEVVGQDQPKCCLVEFRV